MERHASPYPLRVSFFTFGGRPATRVLDLQFNVIWEWLANFLGRVNALDGIEQTYIAERTRHSTRLDPSIRCFEEESMLEALANNSWI